MFMRRRFISLNDVVYYDYNDYMTIEALEDGVIIKTPRDVEYGINGAGWKKLKKDYSLSLTKGQFISFKCYLSSGSFGTIKITGGKCYLRGNCLSLIHGDGKDLSIHNYAFDNLFENNTSIIGFEASFLRATTLSKHCYSCMFKGCTSLTTAPELPATTLAEFCYYYMFSGCKSLTTAPNILPATSLARDCYKYMFYGCSSLTTAPKLPATTLGDNCYYSMFRDCTSLTTAPELPATTLKTRCYYYMFNGCKKINYIKMLATDISASNCLSGWVSSVASSGTFVKNPAMTTLPTGESGIPSGWTVVNDGEESGGKIVNTIVLRPYVCKGGKFNYLSIDYEISYPITSDIEVTFYTNGLNQKSTIYFFDYSGQNGTFTDVDMNPESAEIQVISIDPQEDDTYIYDVVIEY